MGEITVSVKHQGKSYTLSIDPVIITGLEMRQKLGELTGVPLERMKVMSKGGMIKDSSTFGATKANQVFTVLGTPDALPEPPKQKMKFVEDMDDSEMAMEGAEMPPGLRNLGNTCYMAATAQALRSWPAVTNALTLYEPTPNQLNSDPQAKLASHLKSLYRELGSTTQAIIPMQFWTTLRQVVPQFNEVARSKAPGGMMGGGYAQQDADECYQAFMGCLRSLPSYPPALPESEGGSTSAVVKGMVEQYMEAELTQTLTCQETSADLEPPTTRTEKSTKIECNIALGTNYLISGIKDSLDEIMTKHSPTLNREASYAKHSRYSRLPSNLCVHMVRFYWRRDINKKAKVLRRVKFPFTLDLMEVCTPELREKMQPLNRKLCEVERLRRDRAKVLARTHRALKEAQSAVTGKDKEPAAEPAAEPTPAEATSSAVPDAEESLSEREHREREKKELLALINEDLKKDVGASASGLYDLCGIVTHKGASADSGHYIGYVRKDCITPAARPGPNAMDEDGKSQEEWADEFCEDWYKFDDDKVTPLKQEGITQLEGGGEDSVAYILLYRERQVE